PDRPHGVRTRSSGDGRGPRGSHARGHPAAEDVRGRVGVGGGAGRGGGLHPRQLLRDLSAGGLPVYRARLCHRRPRRLRVHPGNAACRPGGGRGAERDYGLSSACLQGRLRLRVLYPHRIVPPSGTLWTVLAAVSDRGSLWARSCSWPSSTPFLSSTPATRISRRWASSSS